VDGTDYNTAWTAPAGGGIDHGYGAVADNTVVAVVLPGSRIPLTDTISSPSVVFDLNFIQLRAAGTYLIQYTVELASPVPFGVGVFRTISGSAVSSLTVESGPQRTLFTKSALITVTGQDLLELRAFGGLGAITIAEGSLTILKVK